jgi:hypothetical protein
MLWQEGVLSHAVMQAAVMIHRMLWWKKGVLSLRHMQAAAVVTECSGGGRIPALSCKLAAVVIHRMLVEEGVHPCAAMQARCQ